MLFVPTGKTKLSKAELLDLIAPFGNFMDQHPLYIIAIRGYYLNTMGKVGKNDINIYDDAVFIEAPGYHLPFNFNTDPSKDEKGIATLKANELFLAHKFDFHNGSKSSYPAICQRLGQVTVLRNGIEDTGNFGINIHSGGDYSTGSRGCLTVPRTQYQDFYNCAANIAIELYGKEYRNKIIPVIVLDKNV